MKNSHIEWTDHTFNPWEGCTKVSPGCAHCYAEARNQRFAGGANWGPGAPRRRTSAANWKQPLRWNRETWDAFKKHLDNPIPGGPPLLPPPRVFCASLADWLDDEVPAEWLSELLDLIRCTPHLDWLLLTKRPQNWRARLTVVMGALVDQKYPSENLYTWVRSWLEGIPRENIWAGTTAENQPLADERILLLISIPARVRFLSCEPLLGPVDLSITAEKFTMVPGIHWLIAGGESGHGARPMHPDWARGLRDQCAAAGVPFFFKQWGEHDSTGRKVGKLAAGRLLDGKEHNEVPA